MDYLVHTFREFNLLQFFLTVLFTVLWTRTNTNKEIKTLSEQIKADVTEVKNEINQNALLLNQAMKK
jgi:energy-converting hydrogenase Eha subunit H